MANILVTGGTGLIGSRITEHLMSLKHRVATYDLVPNPDNIGSGKSQVSLFAGDICDADKLADSVAGHETDYIVHMAAVVSDTADADPRLTMAANVGGVANVLAAARTHRVRRVVWASSAAALGTNSQYDGNPVAEEYDVRPATLYGCSKLAAEIIATNAKKSGVDCIGIRPALIYGLGRLTGGAGAFNSAVRDVALGRPAVVHALDGVRLQLMYNRDFARLIEHMLFSTKADLLPVYNMPSRETVSAEDIASVLKRLCPDAQIEIRSSPPWQPLPPLMDGRRAGQDFDFRPQHDIESAFREMIGLFQAQEPA
jgi:nucleoside-diphosphate-sugar epimerase